MYGFMIAVVLELFDVRNLENYFVISTREYKISFGTQLQTNI